MAVAVYSYSADLVDVIVAGVPGTTGQADGEFCKITYQTDLWTTKQGTDGSVTRVKVVGRQAEIDLTFVLGSPMNTVLSGIYNASLASPNGADIFPILIQDRNGTSVHAGASAWIKKEPDVAYGREVPMITWTISIADLKMFIGSL
jgi:hypothetical protein